jgi:Zn finger protein HypA/HybF involved in hydrogenase expression
MFNDPKIYDIIKESTSIAQVLTKLGLKAAGGNYRTFDRFVKKNNIDTSHFTGMLWSKGKQLPPKKELKEYLCEGIKITSHRLKQRLIKENIFEHKCYICNLSEWMGKPIPIELDHINGNHDDNSLENLRIICPNCHAQTDTYRAKNRRDKKPIKEKIIKETKKYYCPDCNKEIKKDSRYCEECSHIKSRKVERPDINTLVNDIKNLGYSGAGRKYGVSDNAIRKWLKNYS